VQCLFDEIEIKMRRPCLQRPVVEAILAAEVAPVGQIKEYGSEIAELGEGIDMISLESKFDFLHLSLKRAPLML
jgi:hypothetical protein